MSDHLTTTLIALHSEPSHSHLIAPPSARTDSESTPPPSYYIPLNPTRHARPHHIAPFIAPYAASPLPTPTRPRSPPHTPHRTSTSMASLHRRHLQNLPLLRAAEKPAHPTLLYRPRCLLHTTLLPCCLMFSPHMALAPYHQNRSDPTRHRARAPGLADLGIFTGMLMIMILAFALAGMNIFGQESRDWVTEVSRPGLG